MLYTPDKMDTIIQDPRYQDIGALPSQFHPYPKRDNAPQLKKLFARPFETVELKILSRAAALDDIEILKRAVDLVISHPVDDLTNQDFFYVLAWLRIYSRPQTPIGIQWTCNRPYFKRKVKVEGKADILFYTEPATWPEDPEELKLDFDVEPCGAENTYMVKNRDLTTVDLPEDFSGLPEGFDFPRAAILADLEAALQDPDYTNIAGGIQWIAGDTWKEKCEKADANVGLIYDGLSINAATSYGVVEHVTVNCNKCRAEEKHQLALTAMSFFQ